MAPVVHLIDAHVYVFRAWFSLPPMLAADGTPCGAAYGFANTLIRYLGERDPSHVACCFDFALTSFRNELFPGYKASRGEQAPAELEPQFALCQAAARALGVPVFEAERYEADDVIAAFGGLDAFPADPLLWSAAGLRGAERLASRFAAHRERAFEVRALATLVRDVPALDVELEQLAWRGADAPAFDALCRRLGWGRIATRVPRWRPEV